MHVITQQAIEHWRYVAPLLSVPDCEADFSALVEALDEMLDMVGDDETHPLMGLIHHMGDMVSAYENKYLPMPQVKGASALAFLMNQHGLGQGDLSDVANQSVISEILAGKRQLNIRHIKALSNRFNVSTDTFI